MDETKLIQQELELYRNRNSNLDRELKELQSAIHRDSSRIENISNEHTKLLSLLAKDLQKLEQEEKELTKNGILLKKKVRGLEWSILKEKQKDKLLRNELLRQCDSLQTFLVSIVNSPVEKRLRAIKLLRNEIRSNTIETIEAADRLFSLYETVDREVHSTDVWQSGPPQAGSSGRFYYIRVGLLYSAAVEDNGNSAYHFHNGTWVEITTQEEKERLLSAAESAIGSRPPQLTSLPMIFFYKTEEEEAK